MEGFNMAKYKEKVKCDVCGKNILMPAGRIEWAYAKGEAHICHHDCSYGIGNYRGSLSDLILDQASASSPDYVYMRLGTIPDSHGAEYKNDCDRIKSKIFE